MKVQANDSTVEATSKSNKRIYTKDNLPKKKWMTDGSIREKLETHVQMSKGSFETRALAATNEKAAATGVVEKKEFPENSLVNSDVKNNDPKDPVTTEKLKSVLTSGGFNFSPAERENLERILGKK